MIYFPYSQRYAVISQIALQPQCQTDEYHFHQ
jgi:hypothetical protein